MQDHKHSSTALTGKDAPKVNKGNESVAEKSLVEEELHFILLFSV